MVAWNQGGSSEMLSGVTLKAGVHISDIFIYALLGQSGNTLKFCCLIDTDWFVTFFFLSVELSKYK